jgi:hypothetical protein
LILPFKIQIWLLNDMFGDLAIVFFASQKDAPISVARFCNQIPRCCLGIIYQQQKLFAYPS